MHYVVSLAYNSVHGLRRIINELWKSPVNLHSALIGKNIVFGFCIVVKY